MADNSENDNKTHKKSFHETAVECNGVSVGTFFDELRRQVRQWFDEHPEERNNPSRVNE